SDSEPVQPGGNRFPDATGVARPDRTAQPAPSGGGRRSRNRDPQLRLRNGLPAADLGAGTYGPERRNARDAEALRLRPRQTVVRPGLPAGPADGGTRRAVHQYLSRRLGRSLGPAGKPYAELPGDR